MTPAQLYTWRIDLNLTQADAATLLGIKVRWLRYAEAGTDSRGKPRDRIPPAIELAIRDLDEARLRQHTR